MKVLLLSFLFIFSVTSIANEKNVVKKKSALIEVPGMVCQMCVQGMQKSFKSVVKNPKKDVLVDLDKKTVEVNFEKVISEDEIKKRVNDAGYNAKKITWKK